MRRAAMDLTEACAVMFGAEVNPDDIIRKLTAPELKRVYRLRCLESHPDRARLVGLGDDEALRRTQRINAAHLVLQYHVDLTTGVGHHRRPVPPPARRPEPAAPKREQFWRASVPTRSLLFGQYLYFRGLVSWQRYIDALVWQKKLHVPWGEVAVGAGAIDRAQLDRLLQTKPSGARVGDHAVAAGLLSDAQRRSVVAEQRLRCRPLGQYFVEAKLLTSTHVASLVMDQRRHNDACEPRAAAR